MANRRVRKYSVPRTIANSNSGIGSVKETGMPVVVAENTLDCVVLGTGKVLDQIKLLKRIAMRNL